MIQNVPSLDLVEFIETKILPQYAAFDAAHNMEHVTRVIRHEDHRASASHSPRSIYGKIVAEADRDIEKDVVIRRTIQYGLANYPQLDHEGHWKRFKEHMDNKYSKDGYIKLWIPNSPNALRLNELRNLIANPAELRKAFEKIFLEVSGEK